MNIVFSYVFVLISTCFSFDNKSIILFETFHNNSTTRNVIQPPVVSSYVINTSINKQSHRSNIQVSAIFLFGETLNSIFKKYKYIGNVVAGVTVSAAMFKEVLLFCSVLIAVQASKSVKKDDEMYDNEREARVSI